MYQRAILNNHIALTESFKIGKKRRTVNGDAVKALRDKPLPKKKMKTNALHWIGSTGR